MLLTAYGAVAGLSAELCAEADVQAGEAQISLAGLNLFEMRLGILSALAMLLLEAGQGCAAAGCSADIHVLPQVPEL